MQALILERGAKAFVVPNNFPIGCWASYLSRFHSDNPEDYDEHRCLRWLNDFSQKHNRALHEEIVRLRSFYPDVKLIYADSTTMPPWNSSRILADSVSLICPPHSTPPS